MATAKRSSTPKKGLGRGLSALLADVEQPAESGAQPAIAADKELPIDVIEPNPDQPRRMFREEALEELAASIREKGVIQPVIVRPHPSKNGHYQIVAGERRWRAAQRASIHNLPVVIRDLTDTEVLELAIVENVQRADLNPMEEALGYRQLMDRFGHTQEKLAASLGKSRSHIANILRLLTLPEVVQAMVNTGALSAGHARALIGAEDPVALAQHVVDRGLSVRQTEALAKGAKVSSGRRLAAVPDKDADTRALEADLSAHLRMSVTIRHISKSGDGEITIKYKDLDQLDNICQLLNQ
ncbi:ParB/RepB/Spo0J family partition protein [Algicella marina]|uniref:ParB/RepB/Spo0J family partition protein n=1 Tax=Algicella marina TaxID=2683284 RepID=A0A6P1T117_9RHOB|nr:ParB/RepB/Spo0J family partition protein [Algicella marina]QHQ36604.1 ParB/RepB/Spo0J family partition protein [Algicella marina]